MKIDGTLLTANPSEAAAAARQLEELGYSGGFSFEGPHDPFLPLCVAAENTERIELGTAIAVAFARNPMNLAQIAYDLQLQSQGRFILGLGSQIRPHIEKRFSATWSKPAARMREMVLAIHAIWRAWHEGEKLDFRGEFYTHTLMTPVFNPGPNPFGLPKIYLAGVGPVMTEVVGEVADGYLVHPFHTLEFLETVSRPALDRGLEKTGRGRNELTVSCQVILACGTTDEELERTKNAAKAQIAFYGSTPAYRPVLECIGLGELQNELNVMSKSGKWLEMTTKIDDALLEEIAIVGSPDEIATKIRNRYEKLADRVTLVCPVAPDPAQWAHVVHELSS